jgi:hypothetical protein
MLRIRVDQRFQPCIIERDSKLLRNLAPVSQSIECAAIIGIAKAPVSLSKRTLIGTSYSLHLLARCGIGRSAKHHPVVEENRTDLET